MPGFVREHLRPLAGSAALHLLLIAVIGGMALRWTTSQPPVQLAIEGVVVDSKDLPRSVRENRAIREPRSEPAPEPRPKPVPPLPDPAAEALKAERERAAEQQQQAEALREREAEQARERAEAADRDAKREQAARARAAAEKAAAEKAAADKSAAEKAAKDKVAREKAEKAAAAKAAADEARERAAREAEVRRALAAEEEESAAAARAGVQDEYRALLAQAIERSWIRPPSARAGLTCTLHVTQVPGGAVTDVRLGACNGDEAVRESIVNAVYRASPLPPPRDPRAFERRLEIVFRPKE